MPGEMLHNLASRWFDIAKKAASFQAKVFLTISYFLLLPPFVLIKWLVFSEKINENTSTYYIHTHHTTQGIDEARKEY